MMPQAMTETETARSAAVGAIAEAISLWKLYAAAAELSSTSKCEGVSGDDRNRLLNKLEADLSAVLAEFCKVDHNYRAWLKSEGFRFRKITAKQITLIQIAKRDLALTDHGYRLLLGYIGATETATMLDNIGVEWLMVFFKAIGFEPKTAKGGSENFGRRQGMASPAQVDLIRSLWREWTGESAIDETRLNGWLAKFHKVSALRFVSLTKAEKVINSLRAMIERKSNVKSA